LERVILDFEGKLEKEAVAVEKKIVQEVEEEVEKVERVIDTRLWKVNAQVGRSMDRGRLSTCPPPFACVN
jgi:ferritin-like protein